MQYWAIYIASPLSFENVCKDLVVVNISEAYKSPFLFTITITKNYLGSEKF